MSHNTLTLGTRGSELALTQTAMVTEALETAHPHLRIHRKIIQTSGDKRQDLRFSEFNTSAAIDKGIFIKELEHALENGDIDAAVHSLKDVPSELSEGFTIAAVLPRAAIDDVLITRESHTLDSLPNGARVGTSSVRRAAQLRWLRPDLNIVEVRGNVPTRVKKVISGDEPLDAVMLAAAGLLRLGLLKHGSVNRIHIDGHSLHALVLDPRKFLPAAGQGAIAIECRSTDRGTIDSVRTLNHGETEARVIAEREFLRLLGAGCQTPVGAHTWFKGGDLFMAVRIFNEADLSAPPIELQANRAMNEPKQLAADLAEEAVKRGVEVR